MSEPLNTWSDLLLLLREKIPGIPGDVLSYVQHLQKAADTHSAGRWADHIRTALMGLSKDEWPMWLSVGKNLSAQSATAEAQFFSSDPEPFARLLKPDRRICLSILAHLSIRDASAAQAFYDNALAHLGRVHPDIRADLLEFSRSLPGSTGVSVDRVFSILLHAFADQTLRRQEIAMRQAHKIAKRSPEAVLRFFMNLPGKLSAMEENSFIHWVENGLALTAGDDAGCIGYFGLTTSQAAEALSCHENAVWLEEVKDVLSLYARALSGKDIRFKGDASPHAEDAIHPENDGYVFELPPCIAETADNEANFRFYKVKTARLAGYIEFGDYENGILEIIEKLDRLKAAPLARSIFTIIENARIDLLLMRHYPGIRKDIHTVRDQTLGQRPDVSTLGAASAMLEIIYRISINRFKSSMAPEGIVDFSAQARKIITPFLGQTPGLWDSYGVTLQLYECIRRLLTGGQKVLPEGPIPPDLPQGEGAAAVSGGNQVSESEEEAAGEMDPDMLMGIEAFPDQLENWEKLAVHSIQGSGNDPAGQYVTDLMDLDNASSGDDPALRPGAAAAPRSPSGAAREESVYVYDEWDFERKGFRRQWCRLVEKPAPPRDSCRLNRVLNEYAYLIREVKSQFQRIRPRVFDIVRHADAGDEFNVDALVNAMVDKKAGQAPDDAVYIRKQRRKQSVRLVFLVDMSASTDDRAKLLDMDKSAGQAEKRIIDIEIESLIIMSEALEGLDFSYAVYGFSGYGRQSVEVYRIKDFDDDDKLEIQQRICGITPLRGTRMGTAVRHAIRKFEDADDELKILLLLSDGYPQDVDYGEDRRSGEYGLHDTMMAIQEAKIKGIQPFCITFNHSGTDYLKVMQDPTRYLALIDTYMLPKMLPRVVESLMVD